MLGLRLGKAAWVGFPAVLGIQHVMQVKRELERILALPVFEIPTMPSSIPGIRLNRLLIKAIENGWRVYGGLAELEVASLA
jgi:glycerol-3-phosphate dehydrogenase subunit B